MFSYEKSDGVSGVATDFEMGQGSLGETIVGYCGERMFLLSSKMCKNANRNKTLDFLRRVFSEVVVTWSLK